MGCDDVDLDAFEQNAYLVIACVRRGSWGASVVPGMSPYQMRMPFFGVFMAKFRCFGAHLRWHCIFHGLALPDPI